ncbi:MAG: helix-turn-helix domain-containing protein [Terrimicrobiaceae bacterium]
MKSLLYHAFGVKGFRYLRTRYEGGEIIFELEPEKEPEVPAGQKLRRHGFRWRTGAERVHRAQTGGAQGEGAAMVKHHDGGRIRARPPFVEAYTKITRALARLIVDLARFMTLADIAGWLCLSWDTVRTVVQRRLEKDYRRIGYRKVHAIAIDELYLGRARKYITLVIDLQRVGLSGWSKAAEAQRCGSFGAALSSVEPGSRRWLWT